MVKAQKGAPNHAVILMDGFGFGGYRTMYQDYDNGYGSNTFEWNTGLQGPMAQDQFPFLQIHSGLIAERF